MGHRFPGFQSLRICEDLQDFFLQGSAKIVALNLEDPYRSARSLQKCADLQDLYRSVQIFLKISAEICFSAASKEPVY